MLKSTLLILCLLTTVIATTSWNETCSNNNRVDINRLTKSLSNHYRVYDKVYSQISRKISLQFRDAIHVKLKKSKSNTHTPVDVQLLKKQLRGAVGSFIEYTLPDILVSGYNTQELQLKIDNVIHDYCPLSQKECIMEYNQDIDDRVEQLTSRELELSLLKLNEFEIPRLFEKTRAQITTIIQHFNQHTMDKNKLELKIKQKTLSITTDMIQESILLKENIVINNLL